MLRIVSVAIFAALAAALFLMPGVSPARLATKQIAELVREEADRLTDTGQPLTDARGGPVRAPLWKILVEAGQANEPDPDAGEDPVLKIGGARFVVDPEVFQEGEVRDPNWDFEAVRSIQRVLRAVLAEEEVPVRIAAYKKPDPEGFDLMLGVTKDSLMLRVERQGVPIAKVVRPWSPITPRSLLPPLVAIFLAILLRRPVVALFAGVWAGAALVKAPACAELGSSIGSGAELGAAIGAGAVDVFATYLRGQLFERARIEIILFVVFMLAMVGVITKAGGIRGMMNGIASLAQDARKTQIATWFMGLSVFFDDYANTILVGSTMRPLADRFRIAREKLAYIVDSTAAPVAGVSILSTWIAFEVSTFSAQLPDAGMAPSDGYAVFIQTLPYRFYCWFTLLFVAFVVFSGRDFGPMLAAERRARAGQLLREGATPLVGKAATELEADESVRPFASTALIPLSIFILTTLGMIIFTGSQSIGLLVPADGFPYLSTGSAPGGFIETATGILYGGSGTTPLMWGAIAGFVVATVIALVRRLPVVQILGAALNSLRAMGVALLILYLAWMVGAVCDDLGTAEYLSATLYTKTSYIVLPVALFLLSGLIAFSTGSSWSTMTILLPLVVGLAYDIGFAGSPGDGDEAARAFGLFIMIVSIGAVLEGAIFGDHCSPISDTTVMSSIACASDHVDHVRTQAPYALLTMGVSVLVGYFPVVVFETSPWISLLAGAAVLWIVLQVRGKRADAPVAPEAR